MFDLQVLAYQSDLTRVITFMVGREYSGRTYPEIGVPDAHHPISHHQSDPEKLAKLTKINTYHATLFAYYLEKLRSTPDGDGSLLDHMMILYGGGMSDSNRHSTENLPILLVGRRGRPAQGRTSRSVSRHDADGQPACGPAEQAGRAHGAVRGTLPDEHRRARQALRHLKCRSESRLASRALGLDLYSRRQEMRVKATCLVGCSRGPAVGWRRSDAAGDLRLVEAARNRQQPKPCARCCSRKST